MKDQITATLPALGSHTILFHKESAKVLSFLRQRGDLERLGQIEHLGVASTVFTGVNHSRLEYTLLQCAVIDLLPKFHKNDEHFSISSTVSIDGLSTEISSGEELLKSWSLLSNAGHMQWTHGAERALFQYARRDQGFRQMFLQKIKPNDIKNWCTQVIDLHRETDFHYVIILYLISQLPHQNRSKKLFLHLLRSLLIPLDVLPIENPAQKYKLHKLRRIFSQVRMLCIVTLDAYYSHHPVRYQLTSALMDLSHLIDVADTNSGFLNLLRETAGWLADEIYLHPRAMAVLRQYELDAHHRLRSNYRNTLADHKKFQDLFPNLMRNGFGKPKEGNLRPFLRLSFNTSDFVHGFNPNYELISSYFERRLTDQMSARVSVVTNSYTERTHMDIFYDVNNCTPVKVANLLRKLRVWLIKELEATALKETRQRLPRTSSREIKDQFRELFLHFTIEQYSNLPGVIFDGVIQYLLPKYHFGTITEFIPINENERPIVADFDLYYGGRHEGLSDRLKSLIDNNPRNLDRDRLHELKTLSYFVSKSKSPLVIACLEKFVIRDESGKTVDDWDGIMLEVSQDRVVFRVIEAKRHRSGRSNENEAFDQLKYTQSLIKKRHKIQSRRKRVKGFGACLEFRLDQ